MKISDKLLQMKGIVPPLITPLKDNDTLDVEGLERLVEHVIKGGVAGVFILGTTGEFSSISYKLRYELVDRVCRIVNGRIPVLVGITDTSITESVNLAKHSADCGVDAVVAAPPFYYAAGQPELVEYYRHLAHRLPLPLYLYNMPSHTKVMIEPNTVKQIAENEANVIGLKDSSANMVYLRLLQYTMREHKEFSLFVGPEEMTADAVVLGADGGVNGGANMFPSLYVDLYNASLDKDFEKIKVLQEKVLQISSSIYTVGKHGSSYLKGLKCALSVMGICSDFMADPFSSFKEEERKQIIQALRQIDLPQGTIS